MPERRPVHAGLVITLLAILACNAPLGRATAFPEATSELGSESAAEPAVAAVALRLDGGQPQLAAFVGPITAAWNLTEGDFQISAVSQEDQIILQSQIQITDGVFDWQAGNAQVTGSWSGQGEIAP